MATRLMSLASRGRLLQRIKSSNLIQKKNSADGPDIFSSAHHKFWTDYVHYYTKINCVGLIIWPLTIFIALELEEVLEQDREEYHNYIHMRIRKKKFPWGDGVRSLFHNPYFNALPEVGYETDVNPHASH